MSIEPDRTRRACGDRNANKQLANALDAEQGAFLILWLVDKLMQALNPYPAYTTEVLIAMESRIECLTEPNVLDVQNIDKKLKMQLKNIDTLRDKWAQKKPPKGGQLTKMNEAFTVAIYL